MIAILDAFFTVIGALSTMCACFFAVALLLDSIRRPAARKYPALRAVDRDELADRRALRHERGIA